MSTTHLTAPKQSQAASTNRMDKLVIEGGRPLKGSVRISGAKNAALPAMAAALLTSDRVELDNIPRVRDIITMGRLLAHLGAAVETPAIPPTAMVVQAEQINGAAEAPYELVKTMRASILTLGPLVGRTGHARVSLPGGCAIGSRPVDLHLKALEQMGAHIATEGGYVKAQAPGGRLHGAHILFDKITVTGTENILMAASLADGETRLDNCAREPEVTDLVELLIKMGARIEGAGTSSLVVQGMKQLHGAKHAIIPDRIEAGTFLVAGAITGGDVLLENCEPGHLKAVIDKLRE